MESRDIDTPHGPARAHLRPAADARALLVLGHGAGGSIGARDLQVVAAQAGRLGVGVALVEQPYRVAGRRSAAPAHQLDAAWLAVLARLRAQAPAGLPVIAGGRSSGARVACRTAAAAGALGVLCLAFPLLPPGRAGRDGAPPAPRPSRQPELDAVAAPVLIVQGERDPFGMPAPGPARTVAQVPGDHRLTADLGAVGAAAAAWLAGLLADAP